MLLFVVPCFDDQDVVVETHRRPTATRSELGADEYEIIYGSCDDGARPLHAPHEGDARVRGSCVLPAISGTRPRLVRG